MRIFLFERAEAIEAYLAPVMVPVVEATMRSQVEIRKVLEA